MFALELTVTDCEELNWLRMNQTTLCQREDKRHNGHFRNPCCEFAHKSGMHLQIVVLHVNGWIEIVSAVNLYQPVGAGFVMCGYSFFQKPIPLPHMAAQFLIQN
ncbi:hypothetical protein [Paenibacillus sp. MSJ-34]|uniref:hypothetical protein n=1 Tax=Paenibacillus sp. MSJ-34 TaxID=2841529 RepID=UPI001C124197|nr:hypothetical protein [Paenibacillus sp. MSJ-34]MBU5442525.1 hypothetical protein [Paenibacillus sp. MSJ-34]